jgi:diaminopimelate decarboxylase
VKPKWIANGVEITQFGDISVPWHDRDGRSGIAYVEPERFFQENHVSEVEALALHIVSQANEIEQLKERIAKLEDVIERLTAVFTKEE